MTARGCFITVEGIDGAGKSSHIDALAGWLREHGHDVVLTREPGGTPLAEALRGLFLERDMDALTEALLVFAARRDHLCQLIEPALARGATVLCDRYTDATFAYQGGGRGFNLDVLSMLESWVQQGRQPELTLWFDLPAEEAARRRTAARVADRLERETLAFFERVRHGYEVRCAQAPQRFARIDANQPREQVWAAVQQAVADRLAAAGAASGHAPLPR